MFGRRLRTLRKDKKLTMKEFGKKLKLAESTISGYENGSREPDYETLLKIADFFGVSTDYLLGRVDDPHTYKDEKEFIKAAKKHGLKWGDRDLSELSEDDIEFLNDVIERLLKNKK